MNVVKLLCFASSLSLVFPLLRRKRQTSTNRFPIGFAASEVEAVEKSPGLFLRPAIVKNRHRPINPVVGQTGREHDRCLPYSASFAA